jgi:hypothetical protein
MSKPQDQQKFASALCSKAPHCLHTLEDNAVPSMEDTSFGGISIGMPEGPMPSIAFMAVSICLLDAVERDDMDDRGLFSSF